MMRLVLLLACSLALNAPDARADRPNILFIFADDMAWDEMSSMGSNVQTPHLDRLAKGGTLFSNSYNMGAWGGAVCVASRSMLNSGQSLWRVHGHAQAMQQFRKSKEAGPPPVDPGTAWSQWLADAGYHTYFTGKWHAYLYRAEDVFQETGTIRGGMPNQTDAGYNRPLGPHDQTWQPWDPQYEGFWKGGRHWSEVVAEETITYLREANLRDAPFFAYVAFNAPHDPRQAPKAYVDRYPARDVELPESFQPLYPFAEAIGAGKNLRDERLAPFPRTPYAVKVNRAEYFAIISHMDDQIGRILDALEKNGQAENTLVIFSADHGLAVGQHGLLGKQNMYEHSLKAPLIFRGPGVPAGSRRDERVYIQDVVPTTLELAGVTVPPRVDFRSLAPLLDGRPYRAYESIYAAYRHLQRAVIRDHWKLIYYPEIPRYRLYHLTEDPKELHDLSETAEHRDVLKSLQVLLAEEAQRQGDPHLVPQSTP